MKALLKIYSVSCFILVGFVLFFSIPFESLPLSGTTTAMLTGGTILAIVAAYIIRLHSREGIEFGWFLANKGGFWFITAASFGLFLFLSGLMIRIAPQAVEPAFERGAWPVAGVLVVLFWLALNFMFGFLSFSLAGRTTGLARTGRIKSMFGTLAIGAVCLAMAGVFFSLFLEVINDNFFRISARSQSTAIWVFLVALVVVGVVHGSIVSASYWLDDEDLVGADDDS